MSLSYKERLRVCEYLRSLTDVDDVLACMDALTEALGHRALAVAAARGYEEKHYLRDKFVTHNHEKRRGAIKDVWFFAEAEKSVGELLELWDTGGCEVEVGNV